jgi:hypothetical protein
MKYNNAAVATARRRQGPARVQPDEGCAGSPTASGPAAKSPELMWLSLAASTKAWADRLSGDERVVTRARAARYMIEARAARARAHLRKGGAR